MRKIKDLTVSIKAGESDGLAEGQFTAYASVFGNIDSYGDVVVKGAFANTLKEWADSADFIPVLFGHNMSDPDFSLGHVISAAEDDHGLLVTGQLDLENPKSAQVYRLLKGRRLRQLSFAYDVIESGHAQVDGQDVIELRKLKLYEVSLVTIGANQATEVLAVKSAADALAQGIKAGRTLSAKSESAIQASIDELTESIATATSAIERLKELLPEDDTDVTDDDESGETTDQEKASAPDQANDEEPAGAKSEEPRPGTSAKSLSANAAQLTLLSL